MTSIVLDLDDSILSKALIESQEQECSLAEYITDVIAAALELPAIKKPVINVSELIDAALEKAATKPIGAEFMLIDVCPDDVWAKLSGGDRKSFGKGFRRVAESQTPPLIAFDRRTTGNKAVYKRI
jgi:hypothetical protein